jgi:hypothetical protein
MPAEEAAATGLVPKLVPAASSERAQGSKNDGWEKPGGRQGHHTFWMFQLCHFSFDVLQVKHALSFFLLLYLDEAILEVSAAKIPV